MRTVRQRKSNRILTSLCLAILATTAGLELPVSAEPAVPAAKLLAHWPLAHDARDVVGTLHGQPMNIEFGRGADGAERLAARFNGSNSMIEIPGSDVPGLATRDFSLALWVQSKTPLTNTFGDVVSQFDPTTRRGFNLYLAGSSPAYSAMSDTCHVHFGIDDGYLGPWEDCGKPWPSNSLVTCLIVFHGDLYCGIADAQKPQDRTRVFRYDGGTSWIDCGRLGNDPNHHSVQAMVVHEGRLYAGTGIYDWVQAGGHVEGKPAASPTRVFVYEGGTKWRDLGQVGYGSRILCMGSFNGELFAGVDSIGDGHAYRFDGNDWIDCGSPDGRNFECFLPLDGKLYAATHGNIYEYLDDDSWQAIGIAPHGINQVHSMQVAGGKMILGTWPQGYALRYEGKGQWTKMGRLGLPEDQAEINEINDLTVYNGKLYAGVIPNAEFYRHEAGNAWTLLGRLAKRSDWKADSLPTWLRLTCLTQFQGKLYGSTGSCQGRALDALVDPSMGRVSAIQAGQMASYEHDLGGSWAHLAAIRRGRQLQLYVNGKLVATSQLREGPLLNLTNHRPLLVGFGAQNYFSGAIADLRLYDGALGSDAIGQIMVNGGR